MSTWNGLTEALRCVPRLPAAKCVGTWQIWDETDDPETIEFAVRNCNSCPALIQCRNWLDSLPENRRPIGVVAGQVRDFRKERKGKRHDQTHHPTRATGHKTGIASCG